MFEEGGIGEKTAHDGSGFYERGVDVALVVTTTDNAVEGILLSTGYQRLRGVRNDKRQGEGLDPAADAVARGIAVGVAVVFVCLGYQRGFVEIDEGTYTTEMVLGLPVSVVSILLCALCQL